MCKCLSPLWAALCHWEPLEHNLWTQVSGTSTSLFSSFCFPFTRQTILLWLQWFIRFSPMERHPGHPGISIPDSQERKADWPILSRMSCPGPISHGWDYIIQVYLQGISPQGMAVNLKEGEKTSGLNREPMGPPWNPLPESDTMMPIPVLFHFFYTNIFPHVNQRLWVNICVLPILPTYQTFLSISESQEWADLQLKLT